MGGTWPAGLLGPNMFRLVEKSGPVKAHWRAEGQACTDGQVQVAPATGGKIGSRRLAVALLTGLRCSRTGRNDREAPVLSRPSTWPYRDSWTFERDRQYIHIHRQIREKVVWGKEVYRPDSWWPRTDSRGSTKRRVLGVSRGICIERDGVISRVSFRLRVHSTTRHRGCNREHNSTVVNCKG